MTSLIDHVRRVLSAPQLFRRMSAAALIAAALSTGAPDAHAVQTAEDRALHAERVLVRALTFMRTGYPDRAVEVYTEGLRVNPEEPVLLSGMADAHHAAGDLASARFYAGRAVERDPGNATYLEQYARISAAAGEMDAALDAYARLGESSPDQLDARLRHVDLLARLERLDEAVRLADDILERFPTHVTVLSVQAELLHRTGHTDREILMLRRLIDVRPTPAVEYDLAVALERSGQTVAAVDVLIDVLASDPDHGPARELFHTLASDVDLAGRRLPPEVAELVEEEAPADSSVVYRRRLEADPNDSASAASLARLLDADGRTLEAADVLILQTERDPRRPALWVRALELLVEGGEYERAVALGEEASLLYPGYAPLAFPYIAALSVTGRTEDALRVARGARRSVTADDPMAVRLDSLIAEFEKPQ